MAFIGLLLAGLAGAEEAGNRLYFNDLRVPETQKDLEAIQDVLREVAAGVMPATVCIDIGEGSGSGVFVSADGLILTAAHVAVGVNKPVTVILQDGTKVKASTLGLVADTDAAMAKTEEGGPFPFVELDRDVTTKLGDWVFALGHSGGFNKDRGMVLRSGRLVRIAERTIQSDCVLIGGDSGGPLFDMRGKLIGIHSRVGMDLQVNNHVPMSEYLLNWDGMLAGEFIGEGPFAKKPVPGSGFLGVKTETDETGKLRVTKVGEGSPAALAGLAVDDIVKRINGTELETREDLQAVLKELSAGDEVELEYERDGKTETLKLTLDER
jgi:serine protease Do